MNNMTGDPNQQNRTSIFGFDSYPTNLPPTIDWSRIPTQSALPYVPNFNNINPSFNYPHPPAQIGSLQFCQQTAPHPAQFPFPNSPPSPSPGTSSALISVDHGFGFNPNPTAGHKRKTLSPERHLRKQRITEEKMAEHMSNLHISSETSTSRESDTDRTKRLYMCEEMRKLQSDSILPQSILSRIQRPCTALVLWTPPRRIISLEGAPVDTNNGNNNEESVPDRMENESNDMEFDV